MNISTMTVSAIRDRLEEIATAERHFAARDLDAEMSAVMRAGGSVDDLEAKQLEAERAARRMRAERTVLQAELPEAVKREGAQFLQTMETRHHEATGEASIVIGKLMESWTAFLGNVDAWKRLQEETYAMTNQADRLARETKATMPSLGTFQSDRVSSICRDLSKGEIFNALATATAPMQIQFGVQSRVID